MTLTIELSPDKEAAFKAQAQAMGLTIEEWLLRLAEQAGQRPQEQKSDARPVWDMIAENMGTSRRKTWRCSRATAPARLITTFTACPREPMRAVFADTFYWAALTSTEDAAHDRALSLRRSIDPERIVTTDEVLAEYLAFFAAARPSVRSQAAANVGDLIRNAAVRLFRKAASRSWRAWSSTARVRTSSTA